MVAKFTGKSYSRAASSTSQDRVNYTAPAWTAVFAWPVLGERIDRQKAVALSLTLLGVALIARIFDARFLSVNLVGLLLAVASGPAWGLYWDLRAQSPAAVRFLDDTIIHLRRRRTLSAAAAID